MKKLLFTAIAVVALSGVSMANTPVEAKQVVEVESVKVLQGEPCYEKAMNAVDLAEEDDPIFNYYLYEYVLSHCYKAVKLFFGGSFSTSLF